MMNHTIPIVKAQTSNYKTLTPIAPAPLNLAPRHVQVLPKPINKSKSHSNIQLQSTDENITFNELRHHQQAHRDHTIGSTQQQSSWKAAKRPITIEKKPSGGSSSSSLSSLSNNLVNLNIQQQHHQQQQQQQQQSRNSPSLSKQLRPDLKSELEVATEENQKLKNIISRLKTEIDSLQKLRMLSEYKIPNNDHQPDSNNNNDAMTIISSTTNTTSVSNSTSTTVVKNEFDTPNSNISIAIAPSHLSPTIDPKNIPMPQQTRQKRQYRKKKKKPEDELLKKSKKASKPKQQQPLQYSTLKIEDTPSPISLADLTMKDKLSTSPTSTITSHQDLPLLEGLLANDTQPVKKTKLVKLTRSISHQPDSMIASLNLNRSNSVPLSSMDPIDPLSRTTTTSTMNEPLVDWEQCGFCLDGNSCLCQENEPDNMNVDFKSSNNVINENEEIDISLFLKDDNGNYDQFVTI